MTTNLVTSAWLNERLEDKKLRVLDATYHLPGVPRDAQEEFRSAHVPGAQFFDIDDVCDPTSELPHMMPEKTLFDEKVGRMGVGNEYHVVVYDSYGLFSAARVWWMFKMFGHGPVSVLDGGLVKWRSEDRPLTSDTSTYPARPYSSTIDTAMTVDAAFMLSNVTEHERQVVDARSAGRFTGEEPEVRPGLRSGHIPGARNVPFTALLDATNKTLLPNDRLSQVFAAQGVSVHEPTVASCGSGVTACVVALALTELGGTDISVYDGSWVEWGARADLPIATSTD